MAMDTGQELDHHLYLAGIADQRVLDILPPEIRLHRIDDMPEACSLAARGHIPAASLLRLAALDELGRCYDRVIYLDGDVFQAWGTLADLLKIDMGGVPVAAVRDRLQWPVDARPYYRPYLQELAARSGVDRLDYFNSGVMMIDGPAYVDAGITAEALAFISANHEALRFVDQSALNAVLAGGWCELSPGWNWQMSRIVFSLTAGRRPRMIHFTGPNKPWLDRFRLLPSEAFDAMMDFLASNGLTSLLPDEAPNHFDFRTMERVRVRKLSDWTADASARRETVKNYLNRGDFADLAAGLHSFG